MTMVTSRRGLDKKQPDAGCLSAAGRPGEDATALGRGPSRSPLQQAANESLFPLRMPRPWAVEPHVHCCRREASRGSYSVRKKCGGTFPTCRVRRQVGNVPPHWFRPLLLVFVAATRTNHGPRPWDWGRSLVHLGVAVSPTIHGPRPWDWGGEAVPVAANPMIHGSRPRDSPAPTGIHPPMRPHGQANPTRQRGSSLPGPAITHPGRGRSSAAPLQLLPGAPGGLAGQAEQLVEQAAHLARVRLGPQAAKQGHPVRLVQPLHHRRQ